MQRKIRVWVWRYRFVLATGLITLAVLAGVREFRPPPAGESVVVAAADLPAGAPIRAGDVTVAVLPTSPGAASRDPVGLTPIVAIPTGLPIVESMLLGPGLADHAPPGTVLAPIQVSNPDILDLLRVGDQVDLYISRADVGGSEPGAELIAAGVQVIALPGAAPRSSGVLSLDDPEHTSFFGAVAQGDAIVFTGADGVAPFRVVLNAS